MAEAFTEDPKIQQIAEEYALDAVDFAQRFKLSLDWSDSSVAHVETVLAALHKGAIDAKPTDEQVLAMAKVLGSYVGEVFRRNHGATWGMVDLEGQAYPGLKASGPAGLFWPWGRVQNRIRNGPEDNVWHYYQHLVERNGAARPSAPAGSQKATWWRRMLGR
ncbi:MAG TPA: hypothetical protein VGM84_05940 [Steroidobacteraceae bacterium]|jgi:hypothetical protein